MNPRHYNAHLSHWIWVWVAAALLACLPLSAQAAADTWTRDDAAHLLRRAGFGGTPEQIDKLYALGKAGAVDFLVDGPQAPAGQGDQADPRSPFPPAHLSDFDPKPAVALADQRYDAIKDQLPNQAGGKLGKKATEAKNGDANAPAAKDAAAPASGQPNGGGQFRPRLKGEQPNAAGQPNAGQGNASQPNAGQANAAGQPVTPRIAALQAKQKQKQFERRAVIQSLREWSLDRMVRSDYPLEEKMTLFWHGLLTSGVMEVKNADWIANQDQMLHREALGNYKHLIHSAVYDAAVLKYLNNDENIKGKPNENLARELMELFTMGEGNGYTEKDVGEVARALTGLMPTPRGVAMRPYMHDAGTKTIFGHLGTFGPDDVVNLIFSQPQPTEHLALRLWTFFAYPDPTEADLAPVVAALRQNNCEIKPALKALFMSPAFYSDKAKFALIKSPAELVVETMRNLAVEPPAFRMVGLANQLKDMGQELFQPPNVRGWVGGEHWITSSSLFLRYNVACSLVDGTLMPPRGRFVAPAGAAGMPTPPIGDLFPSLGHDTTPTQVVDTAIARFLQRPLNPEKRTALLTEIGSGPIQFGRYDSDKRVRQMVDLLLSTPEYQVH